MRPHDLAEPVGDEWAGAVLLHPHPDMGGDRHNDVVSALYDALPRAGVRAVRFDFSSADVGTAAAETIDALATLPSRPRYLAGYSFGGGVAAIVDDPLVDGWALVAPALSMVDPVIGGDARPKLVVAGRHDQWFGPTAVERATDGWIAVEHETVESADHFFGGRTDEVARLVVRWLERVARG